MASVGMPLPPHSDGARIGSWTLSTQLGTGSSGIVRLAVADDGRLAAIKLIDKTKLSLSHLQRFRSEVDAMRSLEHRHVIELYDTIETIDTLAIVMQFAKNGDLLQYITKRKRLPEDEVRRIFRQICSGVDAAHKAGWIHRDLKVENIYLDENNSVRIGDWGFAGRWSPGVFQSASFGSLHYASPEIVQGTEYVGPEVDVWSLGVVLYALATGALPFGGADEWIVAKNITKGVFCLPPDLSYNLADLLTAILMPNRAQRATLADIRVHKFLSTKQPTVTTKTGSTSAAARAIGDSDGSSTEVSSSVSAASSSTAVSTGEYTDMEDAEVITHNGEPIAAPPPAAAGAAALDRVPSRGKLSRFLVGTKKRFSLTKIVNRLKEKKGEEDKSALRRSAPSVAGAQPTAPQTQGRKAGGSVLLHTRVAL